MLVERSFNAHLMLNRNDELTNAKPATWNNGPKVHLMKMSSNKLLSGVCCQQYDKR